MDLQELLAKMTLKVRIRMIVNMVDVRANLGLQVGYNLTNKWLQIIKTFRQPRPRDRIFLFFVENKMSTHLNPSSSNTIMLNSAGERVDLYLCQRTSLLSWFPRRPVGTF